MIRWIFGFLLLSSVHTQAQLSDFDDIDFQKADSVAYLYKGESLESLPLLAFKLTSPLASDLEKFRAIYTWVCTNIENDHNGYLRNKKNREKLNGNSEAIANWNRTFQVKVFKKLLHERKTVCTGYAYLLRELSAFAGIECKIIDGYGRTVVANVGGEGVPNHSWNAVLINDKWYLCDATWSSGNFGIPEYVFIRDYNDGYFLADPELFAKNHFPLDTTWFLMDDKPDLDEFLNAPIIYKYAFNYQLIPLEPQVMDINATTNDSIAFLFKAPDSIQDQNIFIELVTQDKTYIINPDVTYSEEGILALNCRFNRRGKYDAHIKIEGKPVASFIIRVKKNRQ